jgi:hypothetical protein
LPSRHHRRMPLCMHEIEGECDGRNGTDSNSNRQEAAARNQLTKQRRAGPLSLPHHRRIHRPCVGVPYPKPNNPSTHHHHINTTSSSQQLQFIRTTASSHCQPHSSHTTTDTTMADKFPSVEDLDSGIPLHLAHYSPHLD